MFHHRAAVLRHFRPSRTISSNIPPPKPQGIPLAKDLDGIQIKTPEEINEERATRRAAFMSQLEDPGLPRKRDSSVSEPRKPKPTGGSFAQKLLKHRGLPEPAAPTGTPIKRFAKDKSLDFGPPRPPRTPRTPREITGDPRRKFDRQNERPVTTNKPPYKKRDAIKATTTKEREVDDAVAEETEPDIHAPTPASVPPTLSHDALLNILEEAKRPRYSHTAPLSNRVYTALPVPIPAKELFSKTSKYYVGEKRAPLIDKKEKRIRRHGERLGGDYSRYLTEESVGLATRQPFLRVTERAQLILSTNRSIPTDKRQKMIQVMKDAVEARP